MHNRQNMLIAIVVGLLSLVLIGPYLGLNLFGATSQSISDSQEQLPDRNRSTRRSAPPDSDFDQIEEMLR